MPGTSAGTGQPIAFLCPKYRATKRYSMGTRVADHRITRTGRTKKRYFRAMGIRMLPELHAYYCSCGHAGWTAHKDILRYPSVPT